MGWTHYWQRESQLSQVSFQAAIGDIQKITAETGVELAGSGGIDEPFFSTEKIIFNGKRGQDCEDFIVLRADFPRHGRKVVFSYCKTQKLPYDLPVRCVLVILKYHFDNSITVTSDGTDEDWQDARDLCQRVLGYGNDFKLSSPTR